MSKNLLPLARKSADVQVANLQALRQHPMFEKNYRFLVHHRFSGGERSRTDDPLLAKQVL